MTLSDLEWLSKIFNEKKRRAVSLRQLSFLLIISPDMTCKTGQMSVRAIFTTLRLRDRCAEVEETMRTIRTGSRILNFSPFTVRGHPELSPVTYKLVRKTASVVTYALWILFSLKVFSSLIICYSYYVQHKEQEARLSQRDCATLRVIAYFAKSLKITQDHSKWHCS